MVFIPPKPWHFSCWRTIQTGCKSARMGGLWKLGLGQEAPLHVSFLMWLNYTSPPLSPSSPAHSQPLPRKGTQHLTLCYGPWSLSALKQAKSIRAEFFAPGSILALATPNSVHFLSHNIAQRTGPYLGLGQTHSLPKFSPYGSPGQPPWLFWPFLPRRLCSGPRCIAHVQQTSGSFEQTGG
jgi:hypothetical protein